MSGQKVVFILEGILSFFTITFTYKLYKYNQLLYRIQDLYPNKIQQAFKIASEPNYINYLLWGFFFIVVLVASIVLFFKLSIEYRLVMSIFNFILLIIMLIVFWNPVLATFAIILLASGGFIVATN